MIEILEVEAKRLHERAQELSMLADHFAALAGTTKAEAMRLTTLIEEVKNR